MIDPDGFRPNVGIILTNGSGQVLWARRIGQDAWQFPQGGVDPGEAPDEAILREVEEEIGLKPSDYNIEKSIEVSQTGYKYYCLACAFSENRDIDKSFEYLEKALETDHSLYKKVKKLLELI